MPDSRRPGRVVSDAASPFARFSTGEMLLCPSLEYEYSKTDVPRRNAFSLSDTLTWHGDSPRAASEFVRDEAERTNQTTGIYPAAPTMDDDMANNINDILAELRSIDGFIAAAVADSTSGMTLGKLGGGPDFNIEMAAASNTEVVKAKLRAMKALKLEGEKIEDMLITLGSQYHLIRPLSKRPEVFIYVALDRSRANLAVARFGVADAEEKITF